MVEAKTSDARGRPQLLQADSPGPMGVSWLQWGQTQGRRGTFPKAREFESIHPPKVSPNADAGPPDREPLRSLHRCVETDCVTRLALEEKKSTRGKWNSQ